MKKQMVLMMIPMTIYTIGIEAQNIGGNIGSSQVLQTQKFEGNADVNITADMANALTANAASMANVIYAPQQIVTPTRDQATSAQPSDAEFTVNINGLMNATASNYVAVFNILQVGLTAKSTDSTMTSTIEEFKANLQKIGIDTSALKTDMISFVPSYGYASDKKIFSKKYNEVPEGFELEKNIYVHFKNSSALDAILSAAAAAEIYDLVKVDYFLPNAQKLIDSLRVRCLLEMKSRVKSYELIGLKLDTLKKTVADNFKTIFPETRYYSYSAFSRPSFSSLKKRASDQPYVNEYRKPVSRYYEQVNYDAYDIIINPVITEPVVQLSYSLTVKYSLKSEQPRTEEKKVYYIITKDGEVQQLPL